MTATSALGRRIDLGCHVGLWRSCDTGGLLRSWIGCKPASYGRGRPALQVRHHAGQATSTSVTPICSRASVSFHWHKPNTHRNRRRHARRSAHLSQMTHTQNCEWSLAPYGATGEATAGDSRERPTPCGQYVTFMVETKPKNRVGTMCKRRAEWRDFGGGEQPPPLANASHAAWDGRLLAERASPPSEWRPCNIARQAYGDEKTMRLTATMAHLRTHLPPGARKPGRVVGRHDHEGRLGLAGLSPTGFISRTVRGDRTAAPCKLGDKSGPDLAMSATVPTTAVREQFVRRSKAIPPLIRAFAIASVVLATRAAAQTWDSRLVQLPGSSARARLFGGRAWVMID